MGGKKSSMSAGAQLQHYWEKAYESSNTPFDADIPDEWIQSLESDGRIRSKVLDAGCGPGRTTIYLASRGYDATGIDISETAILRAQQRAADKQSTAHFRQANLFDTSGSLAAHVNTFDTIVDIGCFHSLYSDQDRAAYAESIHHLSRPGATLYLRAFSSRNPEPPEPGQHSPYLRVDQIRAAFEANHWRIAELAEQEIDHGFRCK